MLHQVTTNMKGAIPKEKFLSFQLVRKDTSTTNPQSSSATLIHPSHQTQGDNDDDDNNDNDVDDNVDDDDDNDDANNNNNDNDDNDDDFAVPGLSAKAIIQSDDEEKSSIEAAPDGPGHLGKVGKNKDDIESSPAREHDGPTLHLQSKRLSVSARKTRALQGKALVTMRAKVLNKEVKNPRLYGYRWHYTHTCCFGIEDSSKQYGNHGTAITHVPADEKPVYLMDILQVKDPTDKAPTAPIDDFDIIGVYTRRTTDRKLWPKPNNKAITSTKNAASMVTTGSVATELSLEGIVPVVVSPNPRDKQQSVKAPFGPMLTEKHQPCKHGTCFKSSTIYNMFQMKKQVEFNDAWSTVLSFANAIILRMPEKNGLPVDAPIDKGRSPLGEVMRVRDNPSSRTGFDFHGSGGNAAIAGAVPPDARSKKTVSDTAAAGATFEGAQTITNKHNAIMEQICENGTPIVVFVAGDALPKDYYDPVLKASIGAEEEQAMYMGVYNIVRCAQDSPMSLSDLGNIVQFYQPVYGKLDVMNLRFLLEACKRFRAVPNLDYKPITGGYYHMEVDSRDDRKPIFQIPAGETFGSVLRAVPMANTPDMGLFVSERLMFRNWVRSRGYLQFIQEPFVINQVVTGPQDGDPFVPRLLQEREAATRLADKMAHCSKRKQTLDSHFQNLYCSSIASFARSAEINVDQNQRIGPLLDVDDEIHQGDSSLDNYIEHFGNDGTPALMSLLGRPVTSSPMSHPVASYDPKCLLLMKANGCPMDRKARNGLDWIQQNELLTLDLFFQCILVEVVKVHVLVQWSRCIHQKDWFLPVVSDIPGFLHFVDTYLSKTKATTTSRIIQEQYEINENFKDLGMFRRFFTHVSHQLESWLLKLVESTIHLTEGDKTDDLFSVTNKSLTAFIDGEHAMGDQSYKQPFHSQHILMNMNNLVAGFPFGKPIVPVVGFGASFGAQLLQDEKFNAEDSDMIKAVMARILERLEHKTTKSDLTLLGLKKLDDGTVVVAINEMPLTVCLAEHCCCIQLYIVERMTGGTKGSSANPKLASPHCHPIPHTDFMTTVAAEALAMFKKLVVTKRWATSTNEDSSTDSDDDSDDSNTTTSDEENNGSESSSKDEASSQDSEKNGQGKSESSESSEESSKESDTEKKEQDEREEFIRANTPMPKERKRKPGDVVKCASPAQGAIRKRRRAFLPTQKRKISTTKLALSKRGSTSTWSSTWAQGLAVSEASAAVWARGLPTAETKACDLMLGMIYGDFVGTASEIGDMVEHTTQLRRDTARCLATEECTGREVFTLDNREVAHQRSDRHIVQDLKKIDLSAPLMVAVKGRVHQICLDHFWFSGVYWDSRIEKAFFDKSLPRLHSLLKPTGVIYIGLSVHLFLRLLDHESQLKQYFVTSLVHKDEAEENDLVKGSHVISDDLYACPLKFGNKDQKPEKALGVCYAMVQETCPGTVDVNKRVAQLKMFAGGREPEDFRFIKLTRRNK